MLVFAASATLFACKPKQEAPAPVVAEVEETAPEEEVAAAGTDEPIEACNLTLTAPAVINRTTYWTKSGGGESWARSIHWASTAEKEAQPTSNAVLPLEIVCSSDDSPKISVQLSAFGSSEDDVPMGSGSYPIVGLQQREVKPREFRLRSLMFDGRAFTSTSGTFNIGRFDSDGVQGSFSIDGLELIENGQTIHLEGTFEMPCRGGLYESECRAN
jgi:hypothetical protein